MSRSHQAAAKLSNFGKRKKKKAVLTHKTTSFKTTHDFIQENNGQPGLSPRATEAFSTKIKCKKGDLDVVTSDEASKSIHIEITPRCSFYSSCL